MIGERWEGGLARRTPVYAPVIRYLRETAELTRRELGIHLGLPDYYIGYMEDGYRYPRRQQVDTLARIFHWSPFEFALLTDVEIPYPDWPRLDHLEEWFRLANQWMEIVDAIERFAVAKVISSHPEWVDQLCVDEPALRERIADYGFIALYGFIREKWRPLVPHPSRTALPTDWSSALAAVTAGSALQSATPRPLPHWWEELTPADRATLETVARGLIKERLSTTEVQED